MRTGSAGLLEDKKICRIVSDKMCVMEGRMWLISCWLSVI